MNASNLDIDLASINRLSNFLENFTSDPDEALNLSSVQKENLKAIEGDLTALIEYIRVEKSKSFLSTAELHMKWVGGVIPLGNFLLQRRQYFIDVLPSYIEHYIKISKELLFDKKLSDLTGREFNIYLQIIGVLRIEPNY
ncbi:MAG: hypothetical protein ABIN80_11940 [Dyadobacter sp.]|uniref:hypothetical protein n=1 Tax=Dyadobacter sp. TaxID=1914288 RepID=UPI003264E157